MRTVRRALAVMVLAGVIVGAWAAPAFAHAVLEGTDPGSGATVQRSPNNITLTFSEPVEASLGAIRVFDSRANRIDVGTPSHPGGKASQVQASTPELDDGTYVVTWRVISSDAHPVRGAFTFTVGSSATTTKEAQGLAAVVDRRGREHRRRGAVRDLALRRVRRAHGADRGVRVPGLRLGNRER